MAEVKPDSRLPILRSMSVPVYFIQYFSESLKNTVAALVKHTGHSSKGFGRAWEPVTLKRVPGHS